jgi:hypothetical protein
VNTVMLLFLVNGPIFPSKWTVSNVLTDSFGFSFAGAMGDVNRQWYYGATGIGTGLLTSIILYATLPVMLTVGTVGGWFLRLVRLSFTPIDISLCFSQRTLNRIIALPTLEQWHHVQGTIHLSVLTIGLAFCGTMPLLLPIMAVYCAIAYGLTKFVALKVADVTHWESTDPLRPSQVGNGLANGGGFGLWGWVPGQPGCAKSTPDRIIRTLVAALVLHLCMSMWMYSSPDLFDYTMKNSQHGGFDGNALLDNEWDRKDLDSFTFNVGYPITDRTARSFFYTEGREENKYGRNSADEMSLITSGQRLQTVKDYGCYHEGCRGMPEYTDPLSVAFYEVSRAV